MASNTPAAVLAECHAVGASGAFILGHHALSNIGRLDIRNAMTEATAATLQDNSRWSVTGGTDLQGVAVTLIVSFRQGVLIVTLF